MEIVSFLFKWAHLLFGITWVGLLYYFNFVQTEYFKEASAEGLTDAKAKLAPRALAWFRWASKFTFLTGFVLFYFLGKNGTTNDYIVVGATMGTLMFINVMAIIWPNQKVVLGLKDGDIAKAAAKAALASRTNVLFSAPMLFCMLASHPLGYSANHILSADGGGLGMFIVFGLIALIELNALFGKMGPMATIRGVIHLSLALSALVFCLILFL